MEIRYQNTRADYQAWYEDLWLPYKAQQRRDYYQSILWYLSILSLAGYVALKHDEIFPLCIFVALALYYLKQNLSYEQQWQARQLEYASQNPDTTNTLVVDDFGMTESFDEMSIRIPWSKIHTYTLRDDRLMIRFSKGRGFIIPLKDISTDQRDELLKQLKAHGLRKEDAPG